MPTTTEYLSDAESLRLVGLSCGIALAVCFFLPQAESGSEIIMSWDLASRSGNLGFLMVFPIVAGLALIVMSSLPTIPHLARAIVTALAGLVPILALAAMAREFTEMLPGVAPTASVFFVGLFALMLGLFHRMMVPRSTAARVLVGIGMLMMVLHYLIPQAAFGAGEKVMPLIAAFRAISSQKSILVVSGILALLPFFACFFATIALPRFSGNPGLESGVAALAWGYLSYIPAHLLVVTIIIMVEQPGMHLLGLISANVMCTSYQLLFVMGVSHTFSAFGQFGLSAAAQRPAAPPYGHSVRHCRSCGEPLTSADAFCNGCGAKASGGQASPPTRVERVLTIGRDESCDYVLPDSMTGAGREHARLVAEDGVALLEDQGSTNGTFVNGTQIQRSPIRPGDRVRFGKEAPEMPADVLLQRLGMH